MTKRKWIQLVNADGDVVDDKTLVDVDYEDVAGLMDNVIKQFGQSPVFRGIGSFELRGFASDAKRLKGEALAAGAAIHGLGENVESAIVVQLPSVIEEFRSVMVPVSPPPDKVDPVAQPIVHNMNYTKVPVALVTKCGLLTPTSDNVILYHRRQVLELWDFVKQEVIVNNAMGHIVGPPGTGKSLATLCYVAQLDPNEWNVVWIHLGQRDLCLSLGRWEYWKNIDLSNFVLPRVPGKKLFVCLDGYIADPKHNEFRKRIDADLTADDRLLVCSSMATMGKFNTEDAELIPIRVFYMYSWTMADYEAAVADTTFYEHVKAKLDAASVNQVNEDSDADEASSDEEKLRIALSRKFYYAGGSCRFMFQLTTGKVKERVNRAMQCILDEFVKYCSGAYDNHTINSLYGMTAEGASLFPVSSYVASLFAERSGPTIIAELASRLIRSKNPVIDGHLMEWLLLACVAWREVELVGGEDVIKLPRAPVLPFDPKRKFRVSDAESIDNSKTITGSMEIMGNKKWLQPAAWNQGGYDAVYFDQDTGEVIFIEVMRSDSHPFNMHVYHEVLLKLRDAGMGIKNVEIYFVVKSTQYLKFKIGAIEDHCLLEQFDASWKQPEEKRVKVRALR